MSACRHNVNSSDHCHGCEGELREQIAQLEAAVRTMAQAMEKSAAEIIARAKRVLAR